MPRTARALDAAECRALGSLLEKEQTTPELYPLSVNALVQACNQRTAREPVMDLSEGAVHGALRQLSQEGLVLRVEGARVTRWKHALDTAWSLDERRRAVMALLLLRGPQTAGELRNRAERLYSFASVGEVDEVLQALSEGPEPLVREVPRAPGQKETRWTHLVSATTIEEKAAPSPAVSRYAADEGEDLVTRLNDLNRRVRELERLVALLGEQNREPTEANE